jgi:hypothetical protein
MAHSAPKSTIFRANMRGSLWLAVSLHHQGIPVSRSHNDRLNTLRHTGVSMNEPIRPPQQFRSIGDHCAVCGEHNRRLAGITGARRMTYV